MWYSVIERKVIVMKDLSNKLVAAKNHEEGAMDVLYRELKDHIKWICRGKDEDLENEIWLRLLQKIDLYDPDKAAIAWVDKVAINVIYGVHNEQKRHDTLELLEFAESEECVEEEVTDKVAYEQILDALRLVREPERSAFKLYYVYDLTMQQIADQYNVSKQTVSNWVAKAKKEIQERCGVV